MSKFGQLAETMGRTSTPKNRFVGWLALAVAALVAFFLRGKVPVRDMLLIAFGVPLFVWALDKHRKRAANNRLAQFTLPAGEYPMEVLASLRVHADSGDVWLAFQDVIDSLPNSAPKRTVLRGHDLRTRTSTSWTSWGEIIEAAVDDEGGQTNLRIKSRSVLSTTIDDKGINFQNVALIVRALRARFDISVLDSNVPLDS